MTSIYKRFTKKIVKLALFPLLFGLTRSLCHGRDAAISPICAEAIEAFNSYCSGFVPEFRTDTASTLTGRWRGWCSGRIGGDILVAKLLILDQRVGSPAWRRPTEKRWRRIYMVAGPLGAIALFNEDSRTKEVFD